MITDQIKARAISKLRHNETPEQIALDLGIPEKLIKEWAKTLSSSDLVAIEANTYAIGKIMATQELVPLQEDILRNELEKAAIDIAKEASVATDDMMHAKAVQLCADAVCKLYASLILKGSPNQNNGNQLPSMSSAFETLMRD